MSDPKTLKSYDPSQLAVAKQISAGHNEPVTQQLGASAPAPTPFPRSTSSKMGGENESSNRILPFDVSLFIDGATIEVESGGWGYVVERIPGLFDAVAYHEPSNRFVTTEPVPNPPEPTRFAISVGEALYVRVEVDANGKVMGPEVDPPTDPPSTSPAVTFVVLPDNGEVSSHYIPKVDDGTKDGSPGFYLYKLASLLPSESLGGDPFLKPCLSGSHISHWCDLPSFRSTLAAADGVGVIPQKFDVADVCYWLRAITKGLGGATVTTYPEAVEVRGTMTDGDLFVYYGDAASSAEPFMEWKDGFHITGTEVVGDEAVPPEITPLNIFIPTVEDLGVTAQVKVTNLVPAGPLRDAGARKYLVRGNSNDATFSISVNGGSPATLFNCVDGLVPTESTNIDITIPDPGPGFALPDGTYTGDLLVWNANATPPAWEVLTAPEPPLAGQKIFIDVPGRGSFPAFLTLDEIAVNICEDGDPDNPYIIYGRPNLLP